MEEARDFYSRWPSLSTDEKRRTIENLTKRITISTDEIDISFCNLTGFREMTNRQRIVTDSLPPPK